MSLYINLFLYICKILFLFYVYIYFSVYFYVSVYFVFMFLFVYLYFECEKITEKYLIQKRKKNINLLTWNVSLGIPILILDSETLKKVSIGISNKIINHSTYVRGALPPTVIFFPLLKTSLGNPYLKILDL